MKIFIKKSAYKLETDQLLQVIFYQFFMSSDSIGLCDLIINNVPPISPPNPPLISPPQTSGKTTSGETSPLKVYVSKLYMANDSINQYYALGKVLSGSLYTGQQVQVFSSDANDFTIETIEQLYLYQTRFKLAISSISQGNWVLIKGISKTIQHTATLYAVDQQPVDQPVEPKNKP